MMGDVRERSAPIAVAALPAANTNAGAMVRLFLLEAVSPGRKDYIASENLAAMRLMRQVIENRLKDPALYSARGADSETDIVTMGNQYAGFGSYPVLPARMALNLTTILKWASDPKWPTQAKYAQFVNDAVLAASEQVSPPVASHPDVTAWRTKGSGSPGRNFVEVGSWSGNTFYSTSMPVPRARQRH